MKKKKNKYILKVKNKLLEKFDENDDGKLDINDIILKCVRLPGVKINREKFLRSTLKGKVSKDKIEFAILENPMTAGIDDKCIDKIARKVIKREKIRVSALSASFSMTGGLISFAVIPIDKVQYYGYLLRSIQELLYLYGFPQLDLEYKDDTLEEESMGIIVACLGVMFGIGIAGKLIQKVAPTLVKGAGKKVINKAMTKPIVWYSVTRKICNVFALKLSTLTFKEILKKAIPAIGFVVGGTATYLTFTSCCKRLSNQLKDTALSNCNYNSLDDDLDLDDEINISVDEQKIKVVI